jgi:hypothetical protein
MTMQAVPRRSVTPRFAAIVAMLEGAFVASVVGALTGLPLAYFVIPVAGAMGGWLAPQLDPVDRVPIRAGLGMALATGAASGWILAVVAGMPTPYAFIYGAVPYALPAAALLVVPGLAWAALMTALARRGWL